MADEKKDSGNELRKLPEKPKWVLDMPKLPELNKYTLRSESDIKKIETAFNTFEKILNQRKEECLKFAHEAVAKYSNEKKKSKGKGAKSPKKGGNIKVEYLVLNVENMRTQLTKLGTELGEIEYGLYREQRNCVGKARECTYYEDYNSKAQRLLDEENATLDTENKKLNDMKAAYKAQLKTVLPPLAKANKALKELTKNQLDEFRGFKKPARIVISVVKCVAMMVGTITQSNEKHYREWKDVKKLVKPELVENMMSFDYDITNKDHKIYRDIIEEKWLKKKDITHARAKQANPTAGKLMAWLRATIVK